MTKQYDSVAIIHVDPQKGFTELCPDELPIKDGQYLTKVLRSLFKYGKIKIVSKDSHPSKAQYFSNENLNPIECEEVKSKYIMEEEPQDFAFVASQKIPTKDMDVTWRPHCVVSTYGHQLLDGLDEREYNLIIYKGLEDYMHPYGACYHDLQGNISTGLIEFLKVNKIQTCVLGGLAYDYCVKTTALQLLKKGFIVIVAKFATKSLSKQSEESALAVLSLYKRYSEVNNEEELTIKLNKEI